MSATDLPQRLQEANANDQFRRRWSPRSMTAAPLAQSDLEQLFEAARWSPSCFNSQPWQFVYAHRDTPVWETMLANLMDVNRAWAKNAGALIAVISRSTYSHNDADAPMHAFDTGSAWMSLALQAQHQGLVTHAMRGFMLADMEAALAVRAPYSIQAMIAVGHQGAAEQLSEPLREREQPSPRLSIAEIAFAGRMPEE